MNENHKKIKSEFDRRISSRAKRKIIARRRTERTIWFGLGMFGLVGWSVAVPTLIGVALGIWLDRRWPGEASWTLTFLIIGMFLGCLNAWYWLKKESHPDQNGNGDNQKEPREESQDKLKKKLKEGGSE